MALISPYEVINNAPVKRDYPTTYLCTMLDVLEHDLVVSCFGDVFYALLKVDKIDYSTVPEYTDGKIPQYINGLIYSLGAHVFFDNCLFVSLEDNNMDAPSMNTWGIAPKFNTPCYNDLWDLLKMYLSLMIINKTLVYTTYQIGAKGVTMFDLDAAGTHTAGKDGLNSVQKNLIQNADLVLANLKVWVIAHKDICPTLAIIPFVSDLCGGSCNPSNRRARRIYFKY